MTIVYGKDSINNKIPVWMDICETEFSFLGELFFQMENKMDWLKSALQRLHS